ncbi:MAG: HAMP domain-containing protein [Pseudomonadales bacterium]|nr:HAMP domain-containing protein [Pseudomonadales bacterium]
MLAPSRLTLSNLSITIKLTGFILLLITATVFSSSFYIYTLQINSINKTLGEELERMARAGVHLIPLQEHQMVLEAYLDNEPQINQSHAFQEVQQALRLIKKENRISTDVYTIAKFDWLPESMVFIAMSNQQTYVGNSMSMHPDVLSVFSTGLSIHSSLYSDSEGAWVSGFAPIFNAEGEVEAVLEIDYRADEEVAQARQRLLWQITIPPAAATTFAMLVVFTFSSGFTRPLRRLAAAAKKIGRGDFDIILDARTSKDEVGILISAFREMVSQLEYNHRVIKDYTDNLETKVADRTQKLQASNDRMEQVHEALKLKQQQLAQSEKMASLGLISAGVAHEINNPMSYIISNLEVLNEYHEILSKLQSLHNQLISALTEDDSTLVVKLQQKIEILSKTEEIPAINNDFKAAIDDANIGAQRVKEIVVNLQTFSQSGSAIMVMANINTCIQSTVKLVWNEIKYHCKLDESYADLPDTLCFPNEINQVVLNLLINASQAITDEGVISIKTQLIEQIIILSITDTGTGIADALLNKLFDPFFTTKPVGKGTGLGLSISYEIIKKHNGHISVQSQIDKGTCFTVHLPVRTENDQK